MKTLFLIITIFLLPSISFADDLDEKCKKIGDLAYTVMVGRQGDIGMSKMIKGFASIEGSRAMIIEAFDTPRYNTNQNKRQAWSDFRDEMALRCYKGQ